MAVIEITRFRLAGGVDEEAFLQADEAVRTSFLYQQPGLVRATTARDGGDGSSGGGSEWITIVLWGSPADADAAARAAGADPASTRLTELVDSATVERRRYTTLD